MNALAPASYRDRLTALDAAGVVEPHLDAWAARQGAAPPLGWRREYGRLRPGSSPWAVLAYSADSGRIAVRVEVLDELRANAEPALDGDGGLVALLVSDCRDDPDLPGLGAVLDALAEPAVVRYRPGNRCTVRGGHGVDARFVKVTRDEPDQQVEAGALWAASCAGLFGFAVAEPRGWDLRSRSSWYGVVPGVPIAGALLGPDGPAMAERVGTAIAELAQTPLSAPRAVGAPAQLDRTGRVIGRTIAAAPELGPTLERVLRLLDRLHEGFPGRALVPVHGSPHMHQWLDDADRGRLGVVDFDRFALGEPELDLATFLVELESESGRETSMLALEAGLLVGFEAVAGPIDPMRLATYTLHKRLAKVARTACGLRPDGAARAARHLDALTDDLVRLDRLANR